MDVTPPATPVAVQRPAYADEPRLVRWAQWLSLLGFLVIGLSLVAVVLAAVARRNGEFGADTALRNAVLVVLLQILLVATFIVASNAL